MDTKTSSSFNSRENANPHTDPNPDTYPEQQLRRLDRQDRAAIAARVVSFVERRISRELSAETKAICRMLVETAECDCGEDHCSADNEPDWHFLPQILRAVSGRLVSIIRGDMQAAGITQLTPQDRLSPLGAAWDEAVAAWKAQNHLTTAEMLWVLFQDLGLRMELLGSEFGAFGPAAAEILPEREGE